MSITASKLLVKPDESRSDYLRLSPKDAGWEYLNFSAHCLEQGRHWEFETGENELALVLFGGRAQVRSNRGNWDSIGRRAHVFDGMPSTLYLPRRTRLTVSALTPTLDFAAGWCPTDQDHPARLVTPEQVGVEIRGGGNASRQINSMLPPGFDCHRLVVVEVYTPAGNWSSYPPHKHDTHRVSPEGRLLEADLEEIYFYKFERPEGFAYQRIYTGDGWLDELVMARNNHLVISPEGYHPVVTGHGFNAYYLNILAGSAQSLANTDDPAYSWIKDTWREVDPRLPIVSLKMEK